MDAHSVIAQQAQQLQITTDLLTAAEDRHTRMELSVQELRNTIDRKENELQVERQAHREIIAASEAAVRALQAFKIVESFQPPSLHDPPPPSRSQHWDAHLRGGTTPRGGTSARGVYQSLLRD